MVVSQKEPLAASSSTGQATALFDDVVFLVEDEWSVRKLMENALTIAGYKVSAFADAETALDSLRRTRPRLILTDCRLPGISGTDFALEIARSYPGIPVVGMSGEHFKGQSMVDAGVEEFLEKPVDIASLWKTVATFVREAA